MEKNMGKREIPMKDGIPGMHSVIDYAELIQRDSRMITGIVPQESKKGKVKQYSKKTNMHRARQNISG